jgi:hypothetical protein
MNGAAQPSPPLCRAELAVRYEELRGQALGKRGCEGMGLVLFMRRGMTAWTRAWLECAPGCEQTPHADHTAVVSIPALVRSEAVTILAGMALGAAM